MTWSSATPAAQIGQEFGARRDARDEKPIPGARAGDIEKMPLDVVHVFEVRLVGDVRDPLLEGKHVFIAVHDDDAAAVKPATAPSTITVTLDSTFIRSCHDGERHLEVRVGNVETPDGGRQVFGATLRRS